MQSPRMAFRRRRAPSCLGRSGVTSAWSYAGRAAKPWSSIRMAARTGTSSFRPLLPLSFSRSTLVAPLPLIPTMDIDDNRFERSADGEAHLSLVVSALIRQEQARTRALLIAPLSAAFRTLRVRPHRPLARCAERCSGYQGGLPRLPASLWPGSRVQESGTFRAMRPQVG